MENRSKLFLIDATGALLSFICLGILIPFFQREFGIPMPILFYLATFAFLMTLLSLINYSAKSFINKRLGLTILFNFFYGFISLIILLKLWNEISILGISYLILEKIILSILIVYEIKCFKEKN